MCRAGFVAWTVFEALPATTSAGPLPRTSVLPALMIAVTTHVPETPSIVTCWPIASPSAAQSPAARVSVPPKAALPVVTPVTVLSTVV